MSVLKIYKNGMWEDVSGIFSVEVDSSLSIPGMAADAKITGDAINSKEQKIYKQNDEPVDAPDGTIWIDLDAEGSSGGSANTLYITDPGKTGKVTICFGSAPEVSVYDTIIPNATYIVSD